MPRLYRQAPVNGIWEGSGNVICLDILRSMESDPACTAALLAEIEAGRGADSRLDAAIDRFKSMLLGPDARQPAEARRIAATAALCLQGSLLLRHAPQEVAGAFCASRFSADPGGVFGMLPKGTATEKIIRLARLD
jgi:putative acyl-CoA dehydrogenase